MLKNGKQLFVLLLKSNAKRLGFDAKERRLMQTKYAQKRGMKNTNGGQEIRQEKMDRMIYPDLQA